MCIAKCLQAVERGAIVSFILAAVFLLTSRTVAAGEYAGQFETTLVANPEETDRVVFLHSTYAARWKDAGDFGPDAHYTSAQLVDPVTGHASLLGLLVEV